MKPLLVLIISILLVSCSSNTYSHNPQYSGYTEKGKASYYANKFHGRTTANGEKFSQRAMTAAHKTLPFGSKVRVTNVKNNKSVVVRINDRGPFIRGRIIDLSSSSFKKIGDLKTGILDVKIEVIR